MKPIKLLSITILCLNLSACSMLSYFMPEKVKFPTPPPTLMEEPKHLILLPVRVDLKSPPIKLSEVTEIIVQNYNASNENSTKLKSLQEWIADQEVIYNK